MTTMLATTMASMMASESVPDYGNGSDHGNDTFCTSEGPPTVFRAAMVQFTMVRRRFLRTL